MGMIGYVRADEETVRVFGLLAATVGMLWILVASAESADDLEPPVGYRRLFHVNTMVVDKLSPLFDVLGGMHNVHVNSAGESAHLHGGVVRSMRCSVGSTMNAFDDISSAPPKPA
jgi:hypothetical protein